jgi:ribonucleoside-triphosphate reductase (formate)
LHFSTPLMGASAGIKTLVKRDGREVPFDKGKIRSAILRAAESVGDADQDRAESLASAVAIYLSKDLNGRPPTVDQVQDAVEKVLVEMGHTHTAVAFAEYRDKRDRLRRLRQGDIDALLDGPGDTGAPSEREVMSLVVRSGGERLARWDRERIVDALVRETGLAAVVAARIATEVEGQIVAAEVGALTSSLIRELVDARLVEHGLEDHRRRHMRLGVPLYDAERIICTPGNTEAEGAQDPESTDLVLAERVKREFALTQVFSQEVADAHLAGDLYLSDLGYADRLHSCEVSLEYVTRFGMVVPGVPGGPRVANQFDSFVVQSGQFRSAIQAHFSGPVAWESPHVYLAPFVEDLEPATMRRAANILLFQLAHQGGRVARLQPPVQLVLSWNVAPHLAKARALGPGGTPTGRLYGDYTATAQQFAWMLLDAYRESVATGASMVPPLLVRICEDQFSGDAEREFIERVAELATRRADVTVAFDRRDRPAKTDRNPWRAREITAQQVALNLPRAAYRTRSEASLRDELDRLVGIAEQAHLQKRNFIERLFSLKGLGPLSMLAEERDGLPFVDLHAVKYQVGAVGLNECVQSIAGKQLHESPEALALGERIIEHLTERCREACERTGLRIVAAHGLDDVGARRFAALDLQPFPDETRAMAKAEPMTQDLRYTRGTCLAADAAVSPTERLRQEGRLHALVSDGAVTEVHLADSDVSAESVAAFLKNAFPRTTARRVVFND